MCQQKLNNLYLIVFCFIFFNCSTGKDKTYETINSNITSFEEIKSYLFDKYRISDEDVWISFNKDYRKLSYVYPKNLEKEIDDVKLKNFCDKFKITSININWKANRNEYYVFKDSTITLELYTSPFIEKRKIIYFDYSKFKIIENGKNIFKMNQDTYLVYSKSNTY